MGGAADVSMVQFHYLHNGESNIGDNQHGIHCQVVAVPRLTELEQIEIMLLGIERSKGR